jgi:hypothetical protein
MHDFIYFCTTDIVGGRKVNAVLFLYLVPVTIGLMVILALDWGVRPTSPLQRLCSSLALASQQRYYF